MKQTRKRSVSPLFFIAFVMACIFVWATVQNNREIAQRRLIEPIQTTGQLVSSRCTTWMRGSKGGGPKPILVSEYKYMTTETNTIQYDLKHTKLFDTLEECAIFEKSISSTAAIWYEKTSPKKASLYEYEPNSWGFLYGLILALFFSICGIYHQKSMNKTQSDAKKKKNK